MTFEQLYYFSEVYRQRSITKAADNIFISRQAMSSVIRKLEEEFGVQLFYRTPNGVEPTPPANDLFQSAKIILDERASIHQKMAHYADSALFSTDCRISMPETLMATCGDELLEKLSTLFPYVQFSFSSILARDILNSYQDFDMVIAFMAVKNLAPLTEAIDAPYCYRVLHNIPMYIWCANTSELNAHKSITFDLLKHYHYCTYKNIYDNSLFLESIYEGEEKNHNPVISIEKNFCDKIANHNYYTSDCLLNDGKPFYDELFKDKPFQLRRIDEDFCIEFIYKERFEDYYTIIADFLMNYYFTD